MIFPNDAQIRTSRLNIRLVQEADLPGLFEVNSDEEVTRYLPYATWQGMADAKKWLERLAGRASTGELMQFVIELREPQQVIGACLIFNFDEPSARAEVGYVLARKHWGAGYMLEAMSGLVAFAFNDLAMRRLEAVVDPRNAASSQLIKRLGFVEEGRLRERSLMKGELVDSCYYGLLRSDWRG